MGKPFFIFLIILFFLLFLLTPFATLAQNNEEEEEASNGQLQPAPPPHLRPKHDKSGRTGRPLYKQVAPFPAVGEGLNGSPGGGSGGEPVQDDNELLSVDRLSDQQPSLVMPPLPSISDSSVTTTSRTNLSAGYRCDSVQRFCAEGLICETFSPSYHLGGSGGSSGPNVSTTASNHQRKRRSIGSYHPVEGICSQRTCESKCDLGLAASASSMKCPADSYLVQWVWHDGSGGGEGDDGSKPCCIQTCKCIPDICSSSRRNCSFLYERARLGTEEPGNCCDTIQCPEDTEPEVERSKHPHQQQVAKSPAMSAPKTSCRIEEGEGEENGGNGGEEERQHGERWFTGRPHCEACHCQSGVRVCSRLLNCPLPFNCTDSEAEIAALPDDQCCPPCKSCVNPLRPSYDLEQSYSYRHGESWFSKDHCTECRCTDGQASCYSETCQASAVACARDQSWAPVEGATGGTGGGVSCCHPCTCHLDCGKGVPYMRSPTTGLEVCDCNLTAAVGDLQLLANEIGGGGDKETMNHLLQSTASPGELVSLSDGGDAAASEVNTSPSSADPCLEGGGGDDASCKRSESDIDTANWTQIGVAFALVVLILGGFFVARCYFCSPSGERCWKGKTSTRSGGTSARFSKQSTGEPQEQQQFLSAPVDDSLPEKHGLTIPMHTMTSTKAGS